MRYHPPRERSQESYIFHEQDSLEEDKEPLTMQALYETLLNSFSRALLRSVNRVCKQLSWWLTLWRDDKISEAMDSLEAKEISSSAMVACDYCGEWFHWKCVAPSLEAILPSDDTEWFCPICNDILNTN
jgi:hypothetical protein